jgi:hypothetical protein
LAKRLNMLSARCNLALTRGTTTLLGRSADRLFVQEHSFRGLRTGTQSSPSASEIPEVLPIAKETGSPSWMANRLAVNLQVRRTQRPRSEACQFPSQSGTPASPPFCTHGERRITPGALRRKRRILSLASEPSLPAGMGWSQAHARQRLLRRRASQDASSQLVWTSLGAQTFTSW